MKLEFPKYTSLQRFYEAYPPEITNSLAHLSHLQLNNYLNNENPLMVEEYTNSMNDAEKSGAASQRDRDDIAAKTNEVKQEHRRKLANYKAEYDKKVQVANDTLSKDLSSLENQAKIADANVESHEMYTKQFHSYLEFTQKKADLASGMMWSKRNMPYAHISLSEIIDDLELSGGEAAVHSLTGEKVIQKLNKMDNMGYQFGETWKELRKSAEFVAMYPYDTIKTNNNYIGKR